MCTLSWKPLNGGYLLLFNRDESRLRSLALPPFMQQKNNVKFLRPVDTQGGGTWLLVNEYGISIALLNNYAAMSGRIKPDNRQQVSRGMLPLLCAGFETIATVIKQVKSMVLEDYQPFHLVVMGLDKAQAFTWNGAEVSFVRLNPRGAMLTASAYQSERITEARGRLFSTLVGEMKTAQVNQLEKFHDFRSDDGSSGIRMQRDDACTHSISRIEVSLKDESVHFHYSPQQEIQPDGAPQYSFLKLQSQVYSA